MSLHRRAAKRDANEGEIIRALQSAGAKVWPISGEGIPDLLVAYDGRFLLMEVKTRSGRLTSAQVAFCGQVESYPVHIVKTAQEALQALCGDV